jgi:hypothetical protein
MPVSVAVGAGVHFSRRGEFKKGHRFNETALATHTATLQDTQYTHRRTACLSVVPTVSILRKK